MNSKKLVAVISAVIIFAVLLASCSFNLPIPGRETTTSQTETTAEPQPDLSIWQDKYEEFLLGIINGTQSVIGYELELDECRFDIRAIDSDEIPELLISEGSYPGSKVSIFGYDGYEISLIGSLGTGGALNYIPGANQIIIDEDLEEQSSLSINTIEEYKLKESVNITKLLRDGQEAYFVNNEEVTESEYEQALAQYKTDGAETAGRDMYELKAEYVYPVIEGDPDSISTTAEQTSEEITSQEEASSQDESVSGFETEIFTESITPAINYSQEAVQ
ncbi:MAG: hypothetical protein IJL77_06845 [Clostridia bacterium]|nr:hypothetical protein [Clostridia bacterium]